MHNSMKKQMDMFLGNVRIPKEDLSENIYAITTFDEFLKDETYLFLRTHDAEGHYPFDKARSAFSNIAQATIDFLGRTLTPDRMNKLNVYWNENFDESTYIVPVHSYSFEQKIGTDYIFRLTGSGSNLMSILSTIAFQELAGIKIDFGFQQQDKFTRNASGDLHRLAFPVGFDGEVKKDKSYVVFDDHIKTGSTVANLAGYIHAAGGPVKGFMALSLNPIVQAFSQRQSTWEKLLTHPNFINTNEFWQNNFGFSLDCLTDPEALLLLDLLDRYKENLPAQLREYQRNPDPPFYPKPEWWEEKVNEPQICSLSNMGLEGRLIVLPQAV